ncbi:IS5 family transposase [Streptomyces canus]|uniref:IS5 family transposase n=1 Tax=Streptomyces canus TaxID=58343 RepID=UPI0036B66F7B
MGRGDLTDAEWERLRPFLPVSNGRCGRWRDHRQVIDGILHRVWTGVQWRDLPERFGPWKTVYERHRMWSADGTWTRLLQLVQAAGDAGAEIDWDISVDSTVVRAHQHAAGARTEPPPVSVPKGTKAVEHQGEMPWAKSARPPGEGGAGGEGLGRSRGGFTSKLHLSADGRCRPLSLVVTPGQRADCTQLQTVLAKIRVPRIGPRRPPTKPDSIAADKGYSNGPCREYLRRRGIQHSSPEKADSQAARLRKGSRGGRPPERYKKRNTVERAMNRLKQSRAVATRYGKRGYVFLGTATAAALVIWLRT